MNDCLYQINNYEEKTIFTAKYISKIIISVHVIIRIISGCGQYGIGILDYFETETKKLFFWGKKIIA